MGIRGIWMSVWMLDSCCCSSCEPAELHTASASLSVSLANLLALVALQLFLLCWTNQSISKPVRLHTFWFSEKVFLACNTCKQSMKAFLICLWSSLFQVCTILLGLVQTCPCLPLCLHKPCDLKITISAYDGTSLGQVSNNIVFPQFVFSWFSCKYQISEFLDSWNG